jgi:hypothetical protein
MNNFTYWKKISVSKTAHGSTGAQVFFNVIQKWNSTPVIPALTASLGDTMRHCLKKTEPQRR